MVLAAAAVVMAVAALLTASGRDVGAGLIRLDDTRAARTRLLRSPARFAVRRTARGLVGWGVGLGAYYLLIGVLADSMTRFLADNPRYAELAAQAGFEGLATVEGYVSALFGLLGVPVGIYAAARMAALAGDEADGRLTLLFSAPVRRVRWVLTEAAVVAVACVVLAVVAGLTAWAGTSIVGAGLGLGPALAGALNLVPVALLSLGAAMLAIGRVPHLVLPLGVVPTTGGFVLQALADSLGWPAAVADLSPFRHVAAVPESSPAWAASSGHARRLGGCVASVPPPTSGGMSSADRCPRQVA
jgi:ABC-2 type transport system permease protein